MKQVWIPKIGAPDVLEVREAPDPVAEKGEVRIRVKAAGINFADILARMGLYPDAPKLPTVVGYEVSGIVDQVGGGVDRFRVGDEVACMTRFGGYSEAVCVPQGLVLKKPGQLSFEQAAAVPVNYLTAWFMLVHLGNLQKGHRVLVHSVGGGVGQAALQICKWRGAEVIGTASAAKHDRLKELGVSHCINYRSLDFEAEVMRLTDGAGVDMVLDSVGGKSFRKSYRCLAPLGRLFAFGVSSFAPKDRRSIWAAISGLITMPSFKPIPLIDQNRGVIGFNLGHLWDQGELIRAELEKIVALVDAGTLAPVVDRSFGFEEAGAAHAFIQSRQNFGKVLLVP